MRKFIIALGLTALCLASCTQYVLLPPFWMGNDESGVISAPRFKMQTVPHHHAHKQRGAEEQGQVTPIPLEKIKETHLRMKWSQICLECITPTNRTGAFYVYAPEKDAVICGYGKTADENY